MGRKTDVLLRGFRAAKCLTLLKLATARIKVQRNKRSISAKQMRGEIAQLLKSGQDSHVYITKADALIKQENMVAVYDLIDQFCHAIISRFPMIEMQSNCPIDMKGPIATLIFAAPRCIEISELVSIKEAFTAKYGKEFAAAASELQPDCGVNKQVIELLSTRPATGEMKLKIMKEICVENKVNWTPGEALAAGGPSTNVPAGSSQQPVTANVEAKKVTGNVGSTKTTPVEAASLRVSEAGPSNLSVGSKKATLQGGSKHEGINKSGIAAVEPSKHGVLAPDASKSSGMKHGLSSEVDVGKANASVFQSPTNMGNPSAKFGLAAAGSLKTDGGAVFSANAFKTNETKEEGMGRASFSAQQSLKGVINTGTSSAISGSFKESKGEPAAKAETYVQPVVDAQDGMNDSDNDSFVSVDEERLEDDAEVSSMGGGRESFGKNSLQDFVKADANGPSLIKKPSKETQESTSSTVSHPEDTYSRASSKKSSFTMESLQEDMSLKASRQNSMHTEALPGSTVSRPEDTYSRSSSKKSSFTMESSQEDMFLKASRQNSLHTALPEEKYFRAENRKNSLRDEKGLTIESTHEDMFPRASSKNSSNMDTLLEEKAFRADSRKSSLREKKLAEEQSFKQVRENSLMKTQLEEEQSFEANVEGMQRKDVSEDVSHGVTTESSVTKPLVEAYPSDKIITEELCDNGLQRKDVIEGTPFVAIAESLDVGNLVKMKKAESFSDRISAEEVSSGTGEEVPGKGASLNIKELPESGNKQMDGAPSIEKAVQELVSTSALGAHASPNYSQDFDFATAAKAIAAEAARLAVLDYAKRIAGSSSIPAVDLTDLTNLGLDFEGNPKGSQITKKLNSEGKSELVDSQEARNGGDGTDDVIKQVGDANMEKSMHSKTPVADDGGNGNIANSNNVEHTHTLTKDESLQQPDMASRNDDINPFATEIDKATNSLFAKTGEDDNSSWVTKTKPELDSKAGGFGQEEDHLDIFFKRKTPRFDEYRYSFVDVKSSFLEERAPYLGYNKKESILKDKFVSTPVFDSLPESQSTLFKESSGSFKAESILQDKFVSTPVFDSLPESQSTLFEENPGSFKIPVFDDEGPETYDTSFSFDDGLDKSTPVYPSDRKRPQSPPNFKASARFDLEPEPSFDKVVDEEEQSSMEKTESAQVGQLKWQSKKPVKALEQVTSGETLASDASLGGSRYPLSRRSRKQPQRIDEHEYGTEIPAQGKLYTDAGLTSKRPQGSSSTMIQHQQKEKGWKDEYDVMEKGNLRTKPAESYSDAMNKRPSSSSKRVSNQHEYEESQSDKWNFTSTSVEDRFPSSRTTKSPIRSSRQKVTVEEGDEDFYFAEEIGSSSAGSSVSRRSTKSPTKVANKQQLLPQGYNGDDAEGYKFSNKPVRIPKFSQQDMVEDDSIEEVAVATYKPLKQSDRYKPSAHVDDLGRASSSPLSGRRQRQQHSQEEEQGVSMEQHEQEEFHSMPLPYRQQGERRNEKEGTRRPFYGPKQDSRPEKENSDSSIEDYEQQQEEQGHPSTLSEQEKHRRRLPPYGEKQRWPLQKYEQEEEKEKFHSMPSPDWRQEERRKEKEWMPRPVYGGKQDPRLEKENLDLSIENYEQQQRPSMLSEEEQDGQWKQHQRLPPYGQEKQRRPLPPLQQYKQEEEDEKFLSMPLPDWQQDKHRKEKEHMPRPLYGRKQDWRLEKGNSDLSIEEHEQQQEEQLRPSILSEQEQGGQEKQRQRFPPYGQEKQSQPLPPLQPYEQEEVEEEFHSMPLPDWRQEELRKEKESIPRPLYGRKQGSRVEKENSNLSMEDYEQQQEEQRHSSMSTGKEQDKQRRPSPPYGRQLVSKLEKENSETWQQEKIRQESQRPSSDRRQQGREKERLPSPIYTQQQNIQEEKKSSELLKEHKLQKEEQLHQSISFPEGKQEQDGQGNENRPWPLYSRKQESKLENAKSESLQLPYQQQDKVNFGGTQKISAKEEDMKWQQEKSEIKEQLPARQSLAKDEGVKRLQEKPEITAQPHQPHARRPPSSPPQSTSPRLESCVSDPIILATIPPPVKKPVDRPVPAATTLESAVSAPPPSSVPEAKLPNVPLKPPNVEDLLANFEAFRRARKGE